MHTYVFLSRFRFISCEIILFKSFHYLFGYAYAHLAKNATENKPPGYFFTAFREAVRAIGRTVLVMEPIENPVPLTRAWCVWEIFCTVDSGAQLRVALPPSERSKFDHIILHRFQVQQPAFLRSS